jgi:hypothetical protein
MPACRCGGTNQDCTFCGGTGYEESLPRAPVGRPFSAKATRALGKNGPVGKKRVETRPGKRKPQKGLHTSKWGRKNDRGGERFHP